MREEVRDQGLDQAIRAAGSVTELARRLGISQPSVSNWDRIPAERVMSVEAATGVARSVLRPDLFGASLQAPDGIDAARAQEYALLATVLARAPDADLMRRLARLRGDASPLGLAHAGLGEAAARLSLESVGREYFDLFVGLGRSELLPYASYYLTGFLYERPLARLRADLQRLGIARAQGVAEPEDSAAILCEIMSSLASGAIDAPPDADRELFEKHIAPWMGRLFADMAMSPTADFYARVGALGQAFLDIEAEAFKLPR
jgi:TorA maturation chaperone TorD